MNLKSITKLAAAVAVSFMAVASHANTIVNMSTYGVGTFNPFIIPSSVDNSLLANMITVYNSGISPTTISPETYTIMQGSLTPNAPLPGSPGLGSNISISGSPTTKTINLPAGHGDYLIGGWDGPQGVHAVYYIAGLSGTIDLVNDVPGFTAKGLSNIWYSDAGDRRVPDGGATVALLGLGIAGLGALRRKVS
jgi:hypothetical protein